MILPLLLLLAVSTASCKDDKKDEPDSSEVTGKASALIGTWTSSEEYETISFTFKADGTGTERYTYRGETEVDTFRWSATDYTVTFKYSDGEKWDVSYSVSGNILYLDGEPFYKN